MKKLDDKKLDDKKFDDEKFDDEYLCILRQDLKDISC